MCADADSGEHRSHPRGVDPSRGDVFLQLRECGKHVPAAEGFDFPTLTAAVERASTGARCIMADEVMHGRLCLTCYIAIEDAQHVEVDCVLIP